MEFHLLPEQMQDVTWHEFQAIVREHNRLVELTKPKSPSSA